MSIVIIAVLVLLGGCVAEQVVPTLQRMRVCCCNANPTLTLTHTNSNPGPDLILTLIQSLN